MKICDYCGPNCEVVQIVTCDSSAFAILSFVRFYTLSTIGLGLAGFDIIAISRAVESLGQLYILYISFRSIYFIIDTEASVDPGI